MNHGDYLLFLDSLNVESLAIYGLSARAKACRDWLVQRFAGADIVGFIPDLPTLAKEFCDRPILSMDDLARKPETIVLYAERDLYNIIDIKHQYQLKNEFFIFYCAKPYLDTGNREYVEQEIRGMYRTDDPETKLHLDNYFLARQNGWCLLLPLSSMNRIARYNKRYWDTGDYDLGIWPSLTLLDCGAYTGDSLEDFYRQYEGRLRYAYALEADTTKRAHLEDTISRLGIDGITKVVMRGASDAAGDFYVENAGTTSSAIAATGEHRAQTVRIDDLEIEPEGKLCVKMDVEGHEMPALRGAQETIRRYRPEMAVCVYHQAADIYEIPAYIKTICPDYTFVLRGGVHTVCYGSTRRFL